MKTSCAAPNVDLRKVPRDELRLMKPRRELCRAFDAFRIDDSRFLEEAAGRSRCGECGQSRKYFCYSCALPLQRFAGRVPSVKLPFYVDILKDSREVSGKSTAVHAPIVAREHVRLYTYPHIPDYRDAKERVVLVSPGRGALRLEDLVPQSGDGPAQSSCGSPPVDRAVLIDCTWNQVKKISLDPRVAGLQRVELSQHETLFWRYQTGKPNTYLATIEALFYFVLDVHKLLQHRPKSSAIDACSITRKSVSPQPEVPSEAMQSRDVISAQDLSLVTRSQVSNKTSYSNPSSLTLDSDVRMDFRRQTSMHSCGLDTADGVTASKSYPECDNGRTCPNPKEVVVKSDRRAAPPIEGDAQAELESMAVDVHDQLFIDDCCHQYDNLLFYFKFMFDKIHNLYGVENLCAYK